MSDIWTLILVGFFASVIIGSALALLYIYVTSGFENTGRLTGGLFTLRGRPSSGKSYCAVDIAIEFMKQGREVLSNFPIVYNDGKKILCSCFFSPEMIFTENLSGKVIIHDESHQDNYSREFKNFDKRKMKFYSRCSQMGISYYSIVQHEDRQDTIINDVSDLFCDISKVEIPFLNIPIYFNLVWWGSEEDMKQSRFHPDAVEPYHTERIWFKKEVANSYNTKFFGKDSRPKYQAVSWLEYSKKHGEEIKPSEDFSKITLVRLAVYRKLFKPVFQYIKTMSKKLPILGMREIGNRIDKNLEIEFEEWQKKKEVVKNDTERKN